MLPVCMSVFFTSHRQLGYHRSSFQFSTAWMLTLPGYHQCLWQSGGYHQRNKLPEWQALHHHLIIATLLEEKDPIYP
jgi:hypothetical protein